MNRDNFLFLLIGLLGGCIAGYLMHDAMATRQPARLVAGAVATAPQASAAPAPGQSAAPVPSMAEIQRLREHVEKNPNDADSVLLLANLNFDIQSWDRARELYTRYLDLRPGDPDVMTDLGVCYRGLGQHQRAIEFFTAAQKVAPQHWQSLYNLVVVQAIDLRDYSAAEAPLDRLRALQPDNPSVAELAAEIDRLRSAPG